MNHQPVRCVDEQEIEILRNPRSKHNNLVKLVRVYEDVQNIHMVFELCEGELLESLGSTEFLSERDIAEVLRVLVEVVLTLHGQGESCVLHQS